MQCNKTNQCDDVEVLVVSIAGTLMPIGCDTMMPAGSQRQHQQHAVETNRPPARPRPAGDDPMDGRGGSDGPIGASAEPLGDHSMLD